MVEFYHPKKRRGIAGVFGRTTRVEPQPYWPGLEIDEHDRKKSCNGSNIVDDNGKNNAKKSDTKSNTEEDNQNNDENIDCFGMVEESSTINSNAEREIKPSPSMNDARKGNTNRCSASISAFRSRKRKKTIHQNKTSENAHPQLPGNKSNTTNTRVATDTSTAVKTANVVVRKCAGSIDTTAKNFTASSLKLSTNSHAIVRAKTATQNITPISARKTNNTSDNTHDLSSVSSSDVRSAESTTPRALVNFLLQEKFPVLDEVVSNIREILFGMISRSPVLLQKHLAMAATKPLPPAGADTENILESNNDRNRKNDHGGMNHNDMLRSERKQPPQEETLSKLQDICQRHEMLLDRLAGIESAATRREKVLHEETQKEKQIQDLEQQQQNEQRQCHQEEDSVKLQRDYQTLQKANASLKLKLKRSNDSIESYVQTIEELEESKRSINGMFQSRFDEQFRELSERECTIETQRNVLQIARIENKKLRNRIVVLEEGRPWNTETEGDHSRVGISTVAHAVGGNPMSVPSRKEHNAYSHRIRHRADSLQLTNSSFLETSTPDRDAITIPSLTSTAYNPRIRRNAKARND